MGVGVWWVITALLAIAVVELSWGLVMMDKGLSKNRGEPKKKSGGVEKRGEPIFNKSRGFGGDAPDAPDLWREFSERFEKIVDEYEVGYGEISYKRISDLWRWLVARIGVSAKSVKIFEFLVGLLVKLEIGAIDGKLAVVKRDLIESWEIYYVDRVKRMVRWVAGARPTDSAAIRLIR